MSTKTAMAIGAHPDDIEFLMAGTLLLLKEAGFETHYLAVASGSCGSVEYDAAKTRQVRGEEAQRAAKILGAQYHASLVDDLEILYELNLLRRLSAIIRAVKPSVLLVPSPQDYMEDHKNTSRLAVTAAFARGMPNFQTEPASRPIKGEVTLYHAMPQGLRDELRRLVIPGAFVDTSSVQSVKRSALAAHQSQKHWLDLSQGMDSYLDMMEDMSRSVARMSGVFKEAEGWRRHLAAGFCDPADDPLRDALGKHYMLNKEYEGQLGFIAP
jgi:LmbE family N-acetylglucosaminyl deacetylase